MKCAKKLVALLLAVVMVVSLVPTGMVSALLQTLAAQAVWDGTVASGFASGSGTKTSPYVIETAEQMAYFSQAINSGTSFKGQYITLVNDVYLNDETAVYDPDTGLIAVSDGANTAYFGTGQVGNTDGDNTVFDVTPSVKGVWYATDTSIEVDPYGGVLNTWLSNGGYQPLTLTSSAEFDAALSQYGWGNVYRKSGSSYYAVYSYSEGNEYAFLAAFHGTFDAQGHGIYGLYMHGNDHTMGLFGNVAGTVKNLTIDHALLCANYGAGYVGGAVGELIKGGSVESVHSNAHVLGVGAGGVVGHSLGIVTNCSFSGTVVAHSSGSQAGGIVGYMGNLSATVDGCSNDGAVYAYENAGGIVGDMGGMSGTSTVSVVKNCINRGTVYAKERDVGGIVGFAYGNVSTCANHGTVIGDRLNAGGIVGTLYQKSTVTECYNGGKVYGVWYVGGIAGLSGSSTAANATTIRYCYNSGLVQGKAEGGFVGAIVGTIGVCFALQGNYYRIGSAVSFAGTGVNGYGVTAGESSHDVLYEVEGREGWKLWSEETFVYWDFNKTWEFGWLDGYDYPTLRVLGSRTYRYCLSFYDGDMLCKEEWLYSGAEYNAPVPEGNGEYAFAYWLAEDGTKYAAGTPIPVEGDAAYRAVWQEQNVSAHVWDGTADTAWHGSGTADDPYLIETPNHLAGLAQMVNKGNKYIGVHFRQTADLWLNEATVAYTQYLIGENTWTPIGKKVGMSTYYSFYGEYDGGGHTVCGLYLSTDDTYVGLFSRMYGVVKDLTLSDIYVRGDTNVGGITGDNRGTVSGCRVEGYVVGNDTVGGIVGQMFGKSYTVSECVNTATVACVGGVGVGGIVGQSQEGNILDCTNLGNIVTAATTYVGGIVGYGDVVEGCYNAGTVSGDAFLLGGIAGLAAGSVTDCYNVGAVAGKTDADCWAVGGIVGENYAVVTNCYNMGTVCGKYKTGAVIGSLYDGTLAYCYYLADCATDSTGTVQFGVGGTRAGQTTADVAGQTTGLTKEQMSDPSSFEGFDFDSVWVMGQVDGVTVPVFARHTATVTVQFVTYAGETLFPAATYRVQTGGQYRIPVPTHENLTPNERELVGIVGEGGVTLTVVYYDRRVVEWGDLNEDIRWEYTDDGVLRLIGSGDMPSGLTPWWGYKSDIREIYFDDRITSVPNLAFDGCSNLTYIDFGKGMKTIGSAAFSRATALETVQFPATLTTIGGQAFEGCTALTCVVIPANVTTIGLGAFSDSALTEVVFEGHVDTIGDMAFDSGVLTSVIFKNLPPNAVGSSVFGNAQTATVYYYSTVTAWETVIQDGVWNGYLAVPYDAVGKTEWQGKDVHVLVVTDKNGNRLQNAVVTLNGDVQTTNWEGMAYFARPQTAVTLTVECADHLTFTDSAYRPATGEQMDYVTLTDAPSTVQGVRVNGQSIASSTVTLNSQLTSQAVIAVSGYSKYPILKYELVQGNRVVSAVNTAATTCTFTVPMTDLEEEALLVRMTTADGISIASALNVDVVKMVDFKRVNLLEGLSKATIKLPVIGNVNLSFATKIGNYTTVEYEDRKVKVGFNIDLTKLDNTHLDDAIEQAVESIKTQASKKAGVMCELTGYVELEYLGDGEYVVGKSNLKFCLGGKFSASASASFYGIVGVYVKASFTASGGVSLDLVAYDIQEGFQFEDVSWVQKHQLELEGGAYILWGIGSAGLYGNGALETVLEIYPDFGLESVKLSGEVGVKWSVFWGWRSGKYTFWKGEQPLYQRAEKKMLLRMMRVAAMSDPNSYAPHDRSYLADRSDWQVQTGATENGYYDLQTGAYYNIAPQVVTCGDTTVMVWLDDNPDRDDDNFQTLYYAVLNFETGAWSRPAAVDQNDTFDCEFDLTTDGNRIYLIYTEQSARMQNVADADITDPTELTALTEGVEVSFTSFDGNGFVTPTRLTANQSGETNPTLWVDDNGVTATWVTMGDAVSILESRGNALTVTHCADGVWSTPHTVIDAQHQIDDVVYGTVGGKEYVAYTVDSDGSAETVEDVALVLVDNTGVATVAKQGVISHLQFACVDGTDVLLYQENGQIFMYDGNVTTALLAEGTYSYNTFEAVTLADGQTLLTFVLVNKADEKKNTDVYGLYLSRDGAVGAPVRLTETEGYVDAYAVAVQGDRLAVTFTETQVDMTGEEMESTTDFRYTVKAVEADAAVGNVTFSRGEVRPNETVTFDVLVENRGLMPLRHVELTLYDPQGNVIASATQELTLPAGKDTVIPWTVGMPADISEGEYVVRVSLPDVLDADMRNDTYTLTLAYVDLAVTATPKTVGGKRYLLVTVENAGNVKGSGEVTVCTAEGNTLVTAVCEDLAPHAAVTYTVEADVLLGDAAQTVRCYVTAEDDPYPTNNATSAYLMANPQSIPMLPVYVANPVFTVSSTAYDKAAGGDVTVTVTSGMERFDGMRDLKKGSDYTVTDTVITLTASYLQSLTVGEHTVTLLFDDGAVTRTVLFDVTDSTPVTITGEVAVIGDVTVGCDLSADLSAVYPTNAVMTYLWRVNGVAVSTADRYMPTAADLGQTLTLTVAGTEGFAGALTCRYTVGYGVQAVPAAPIVRTVTSTTVTLAAQDGVEYSMDGVTWTKQPLFEGLQPATAYTFFARRAATDVLAASDAGAGVTVVTKSVAVVGVTLDRTELVLDTDQNTTATLAVTVNPATATDPTVTWHSDDPTVVTVQDGKVIAVGLGTAVVTVITADGGYTASCRVTVRCVHRNKTFVEAKAATCEEGGWDAYYLCADCEAVLAADGETALATIPLKGIDPANHADERHVDAVTATCLEQGHAAYRYCAACGVITEGSDEWFFGDHDYGDLQPEIPAKHTSTMLAPSVAAHYRCLTCDGYFTADKQATTLEGLIGETPTHTYEDTWSEEDGYHFRRCIGCTRVTDKSAHTGGEATCCDRAICDVCQMPYGNVDATHHVFGALVAEVPAVHTATVLTPSVAAHYRCTLCEGYFDSQKVPTTLEELTGEIPTHAFENAWTEKDGCHFRRCIACDAVTDKGTHEGGTATCRDQAVCDVCTLPYGELAECRYVALADARFLKTEATCVQAAMYYESCAVCGCTNDTVFAHGDVNPANHFGSVYWADGVEPTCTAPGYTGNQRCESCHTIIVEGEGIAQQPHAWGEGVVTKEATPTSRGEITSTCTACGTSQVTYFDFEAAFGDVDGNGKVDSTDARITLQYAVGKIDETALNTTVADVDGNGRVDSTDARLILQYAVGKIQAFPRETM